MCCSQAGKSAESARELLGGRA